MALVDYSDSEASEKESSESKGHTTDAVLKRKRSDSAKSDLPPLPDSFLDLYASSSRVGTQDDPSLHGGRQRMIPHIEGNWPTHVYIE
ncbi:poly(U)-specific 3'-to-5' RNA exonuclease, partial [Lignoscripta atroalba]|nr:poly(U)-specific 3'-to-5' RNA exonuclease [Lignoscripta atroalba]